MEDDMLALVWVRRMAKSGEARSIREAAGLSLAELAKEFGGSVSTLHKWEKGERSPHGDLAVRYASALKALIDALATVE